MRATCVAPAAALALSAGCVSSSEDDGMDCTNHHELVADAPTSEALRQRLLQDVSSRTRSLRVIDGDSGDDKVTVNLINHRDRLIMSLDMWERDDGTWTGQKWLQCVD